MLLNIRSQSQQISNIEIPQESDFVVRPEREEPPMPRTQQQKDKPLYAYEKNRTDSLQMPINFYMKGNKV
jgi:hypothetical protein